jgi:uncharacterized Rmd1/YagE family protein
MITAATAHKPTRTTKTNSKLVVLSSEPVTPHQTNDDDAAVPRLPARAGHRRSPSWIASPRVTAYRIAEELLLDDIMGAWTTRLQNGELKRVDECVMSRWFPTPSMDTLEIMQSPWQGKEIFMLAFGVVVIWGCAADEERELLAWLQPFTVSPQSEADEVTREELRCVYDEQRTPKIYNDVYAFIGAVVTLCAALCCSMAIIS